MTAHGYNQYANHGCRCDVCRAAKADYMREARRRGRRYAQRLTLSSSGKARGCRWTAFAPGAERALVDGIKHGRHGYEVHGCRCRDCTTAHTVSKPSARASVEATP